MNDVLQRAVVHLMDSEDDESKAAAKQLATAYRMLCDAWVQSTSFRLMDPDRKAAVGALTNELLLASTSQPELGADAMVKPLNDIADLGYAATVTALRDVAMMVGSISVLAKTNPGPLEDKAAEVCALIASKRMRNS